MNYEGKDIKVYLENKNIKYYSINYFKIHEKWGEHTKIEIKLELDDNGKENFEQIIENENAEIKIILDSKTKNKQIFIGIIDYFEILNYGSSGYEVKLKIYSRSILFDRKLEKKYRVFQDINWTYEDIIEEINKEYKDKNIKIISGDKAKKNIGGLILQYEETDWEFLIRLASHLGTNLFVTELGLVTFGLIESKNENLENNNIFDYSLVREGMNKYYKIIINNVVRLGSNINLFNRSSELNVIESMIYIENNILKSDFICTDLEKIYIFRKFNEKIIGNRIEVNVERVFEKKGIAKMEVSFLKGFEKLVNKCEIVEHRYKYFEDYGINKWAFSYQTFYSQSNTGFFCTPEVKDTVEIYFPNKDEKESKVSWAINNRGNGRFSNYEKRNFHINGDDFNLEIEKDTMKLNIQKSYTRNSKNSLETAESFVNKGNKNLVIICDDYMGVEAIGELSLYGEKVEMIGKKKDIRIESSGDIRIKGKRVHSN